MELIKAQRIFGATAMSCLALMMGACGAKSDKTDASRADSTAMAEEAIKVEVSRVHMVEVAQMAEYTATVEAFKTNNISPSTPGRIKNILVDVGSNVAKGQRVAIMDDVNTEQLRVRIENAEREYNRALKLLEIGGGTQQTVDQLKTELDASRRQYANLMENTVLVSPISGVVTARNYDPGDVTGALPIVTVEQIQPVKVIVNVSEQEFTKVKKGMKVSIRTDVYGDEEFTGTVYLIHPSIDPSTRTFTVEITIDNAGKRIVPGMFARVSMNFGVAQRVVVPDRAVVKQSGSGNKYVYVYDPATGTVSYNKVELGQRLDDKYELISGVPDNSDVVVAGQTRLTNGSKVEVLDQNENKQAE